MDNILRNQIMKRSILRAIDAATEAVDSIADGDYVSGQAFLKEACSHLDQADTAAKYMDN